MWQFIFCYLSNCHYVYSASGITSYHIPSGSIVSDFSLAEFLNTLVEVFSYRTVLYTNFSQYHFLKDFLRRSRDAADHVFGKSLVVMHKLGELRVGIGEVHPLIFEEVEMLHGLQMETLSIFILKPVPWFLGGFHLDWSQIPISRAELKIPGLGITIDPGRLNADVKLCPHHIESSGNCGVSLLSNSCGSM